MEEQPLQADAGHDRIVIAAVTGVARDRMTDGCGVHADLVRAAGIEMHVGQYRAGKALQRNEMRRRRLAGRIDAHMPLAAAALFGHQRGIHGSCPARPSPDQQGEVAFVHRAIAKLCMQVPQCRCPLRDQEAAAGIPIQPVGQLERAARPAGNAQEFDGAEADAAATVHGKPRWLVQHEQVGILVQDKGLDPVRANPAGWRGVELVRPADRRHADHVTGRQPVSGLGPAAVHADLAAADQPVDMRARNTLQVAEQEVVEPSPGIVTASGDLDGARGWRVHRNSCGGKGLCLTLHCWARAALL